MITVTVIDAAGAARSFKVDSFTVDDSHCLELRADGELRAVFMPGSWQSVFREEGSL